MDAQGKPCHLLVSDVALDGNQSMHLLQRWLPLVLLIRGALVLHCVWLLYFTSTLVRSCKSLT